MPSINRNTVVKQWVGKAADAGMVEEGLKHIVYDLSIKNLDERKAKAIPFDTANQVAAYLGIKVDIVFRNRMVGKKVTALNKKQYAIRVIKK